MSLSNLVPRRYISLNSVLFRYATVAKDGSLNKQKELSSKKQVWARVKFAGSEQVSVKRRYYQSNEYFISDPEQAKNTSIELFNRMAQSLKDRGYSREVKPYAPREDVIECIKSIYLSYFTPKTENDDDWLNQPLDDMFTKFSFLSECDKQLEHEIPSPDLHLMKTVNDVVEFYRTPVRGLTTYDDLARRQNELPPNLNIISQYIRFNPETDTFFNGKDAFPNNPMVVPGIRGKQKYEDIKVPFEWPDV